MLEILFSWLSPFRFIGIWLDSIAYSLIDNAYELISTFSKGTLIKEEFVVSLMNNLYVIIGIFALFRIALLLVNSIINPDKLSEKGNGLGNIFKNFIVMFVLLVMTPFIFREAINLQTIIVDGNYVQKLFIKGNNLEGKNPGKAMRSIAIGSLITLDETVLQQCESGSGGTCPKNALEAIAKYREMESSGFSFPTLSKYIGVSVKDDDTGETVYVYNYMFIVTFAAGIFITWVLLSFGIDIAVRMVELTVLEILAPLFIATYIDPKSAKSGAFHKWLITVGKTYASLFIKLAILSFMLLLISIVGNLDHYGSNLDLSGSGFKKLILLFAILIFAKKAPKWIGDMIGVEDTGLGSLGIGKKLGGAALVGGALTKAGHAAAGAARGAASMIHKNNQNRRAQKKAARDDLEYDRGLSKESRDRRKTARQNAKQQGKTLSQMKREKYKQNNVGLGDSLKQLGAATFVGTLAGGKVGLASNDLKGAFKGGKDAAKEKADRLAFTKNTTKAGKWIRDIPSNVEGVFGNPNELYNKRKALEDDKNAKFHSGGKYQAGLGKGKIVEGNGDAKKLFDNYKAASSGEAMLAQYLETTGVGSYDLAKTKQTIRADVDGKFIADIVDADGQVKKSNVNLNDELYVSGTGGAENLKKMFNTYQSNALANSTHSQEQYMQQAGTYQSILSTQNATAQNAQVLAAALSSSLPNAITEAFGQGIKLDTSSMSGIKNAIDTITNNLHSASPEDQKLLKQKLNDLSKYTSDYDESEKQLGAIKQSMDVLKSTFDELKPIVEGIDGNTTTAKEQTLAIELSKLDKTLEGIKKPSDDKK